MSLDVNSALSDVPAPGTTVGPWLILGRLDSGSHGIVFRAQCAGHPEAGCFALKMAKQPQDPRFEREAQLLQLVHHHALPRYEDSGLWTSPQGHRYPYIVMEWIEGFTLYDWAQEHARSSRDVLQVLAQVARGLAAIHAAGVVHRDVKGDNIRVTRDGRAVLLDFGSGWLPHARPLTDTVAPPGTTPYRAPELLRFMWRFRKDTEARWEARPSDDLYSLGVTAYRLVTGTYLPPVTESEREEPRKWLRPRELATVAPELEGIILRLLSEHRESRGTATQIAESMERAARQTGPEADKPILPTPAAAPTEEGRCSSRPSTGTRHRGSAEPQTVQHLFRAGCTSALTAVVGGLVVVCMADLRRPYPPEPEPGMSHHEEWHTPATETPDAGVGEDALASAQDVPRAAVPVYVLGIPMPKAPFVGQRKPPCEGGGERVINGGCWFGPSATLKPPCGKRAFDYEDGCYVPIFDAPRQPTSGEP